MINYCLCCLESRAILKAQAMTHDQVRHENNRLREANINQRWLPEKFAGTFTKQGRLA